MPNHKNYESLLASIKSLEDKNDRLDGLIKGLVNENKVLQGDIKILKDELKDPDFSRSGASLPGMMMCICFSFICSSLIISITKMDSDGVCDYLGYVLPLLAALVGAAGIFKKEWSVVAFGASVIFLLFGLYCYMKSKGFDYFVLMDFFSISIFVSVLYLNWVKFGLGKVARYVFKLVVRLRDKLWGEKDSNKISSSELSSHIKEVGSSKRPWMESILRVFYLVTLIMSAFCVYAFYGLINNYPKIWGFHEAVVCKIDFSTKIAIRKKPISDPPIMIMPGMSVPFFDRSLGAMEFSPCVVVHYSTN